MIEQLYPEIEAAGNLAIALNAELSRLSANFRTLRENDMPFAYADVLVDNKLAGLAIAQDIKLFTASFLQDGIMVTQCGTCDLRTLAQCLMDWIDVDMTVSELAGKYDFVKVTNKSLAFEQGKEVQYNWHRLLQDRIVEELHELIALCMQEKELYQLFPFTSHLSLHFSRCTGYPYTFDLPYVVYVATNQFEVYSPDQQCIGKGTTQEAFQLLLQHMPAGLKPAVRGTVETI